MRRLLLLFFVYVFFSACSDGTPKGIIDKETMVPLLTDLHLANGYVSTMDGDSVGERATAVYRALYKKFDTDSVSVRKSLDFYIKQPEELELMYKQVEANLKLYEKDEQKRIAKMDADALRTRKLVEALEKRKAKIASDRIKMSKGQYDFGLSSYKSSVEAYFKIWKKYPVKAKKTKSKSKADILKTKADTLKAGALKKKLLLKKPERKNDLSTKRLR